MPSFDIQRDDFLSYFLFYFFFFSKILLFDASDILQLHPRKRACLWPLFKKRTNSWKVLPSSFLLSPFPPLLIFFSSELDNEILSSTPPSAQTIPQSAPQPPQQEEVEQRFFSFHFIPSFPLFYYFFDPNSNSNSLPPPPTYSNVHLRQEEKIVVSLVHDGPVSMEVKGDVSILINDPKCSRVFTTVVKPVRSAQYKVFFLLCDFIFLFYFILFYSILFYFIYLFYLFIFFFVKRIFSSFSPFPSFF